MTPGMIDVEVERRLAFTEEEYRDRQNRLRALMRRDGIDLLYVTTPEVVAYLHGFYCGWYKANGPMRYPQMYGTAIHAHGDKMIHFDHPTEMPLLREMSVSRDNRYYQSREGAVNLRFILDELKKEGLLKGKVGMEFHSYLPNRVISHMFEDGFRERGCTVVDASAMTREVRRVKSPAEIALMTKAIHVCDVGHQAILDFARAGKTELEVMGEVTHVMMKEGGELPALIHVFNVHQLVGDRVAASGHAMPSTRKIERNHVLHADLCGVLNRYHGNLLRGYFFGDPPEKLVQRYDLAGQAIDHAVTHLRAGMTVREVNKVLRTYCESCGLMNEEGWVLGYELGLSLPPDWVGDFYFNIEDELYLERVFEPGMVTNLEILFGTAMIDTLIWQKNGLENPARTPRKLFVLPG
jgi:Xaa-Pro aminopeptidase